MGSLGPRARPTGRGRSRGNDAGGRMDRRGFVTTGLAAGLAGFAGAGSAVTAGLERSGLFRVGKTLADGTVRLSSNENPLGLSPAARQAVIDNLVNANRYPGDWSGPLVQALAGHVGV